MIPRIAQRGSSFRGAFDYYMHDKDARTSDRVAWAQTENMLTDDPHLAWKVMAFTAKSQDRLKEAAGQSRAGRKLEKPVFSFSLSWHPEQEPNQEHMLDTAHQALEALGMSEHESVIVAHSDEPQKHVHVIVNMVHPITGMAASLSHSKRIFSDFALQYERQHGKIYCKQREENHRKLENGESARYRDPIIAEAWKRTADGKGFIDALAAKNYILTQGRKRLVVIDPHGKAIEPVRHLEGVKSKDFKARLNDIDITRLPTADSVLQQRKSQSKVIEPIRSEFEKAVEQSPIAEAWNRTKTGKEFVSYLENKQHVLAQGNKRLVIVEPDGNVVNPTRKLEGVRAKDIDERLKDVDLSNLPDADSVSEQQKAKRKAEREEGSRQVFEKLANLKINALKDQQQQDASTLKDRYRQRYRASKVQLAKHYDLPRQKKRIQELVKLTQKQSWWKKITGKAKKERQSLYEALQNYKSAYRRYLENLDTIKTQYREDYTIMRKRHRSERAELKVYLKTQRKAGKFTLSADRNLVKKQSNKKQQQQDKSRRIR